jgi:hypothetical protein
MKPRLERLDLLHLGDLGFTVPAAVAIAAALFVSRAGRGALCWSLLFCAGMLLVGANKIAFMAWGVGIDQLGFKAASGHAAGATAVLPLLLYLTLLLLSPEGHAGVAARAQAGAHLRHASMATGLGLGAVVAVQLVLRCEHSVSEALAGCAVGAAVSIAAMRRAGAPRLRPGAAALCAGAAFLLAAYLMESLHVAYWMVKAARLLSSGASLHDLGD